MAALSVAPFAISQTAQQSTAAETDAEELGEVVVSGFRASLSGALDIKRNSDLVVDAIGGDIGALPDVTIAVRCAAPGMARTAAINQAARSGPPWFWAW